MYSNDRSQAEQSSTSPWQLLLSKGGPALVHKELALLPV